MNNGVPLYDYSNHELSIRRKRNNLRRLRKTVIIDIIWVSIFVFLFLLIAESSLLGFILFWLIMLSASLFLYFVSYHRAKGIFDKFNLDIKIYDKYIEIPEREFHPKKVIKKPMSDIEKIFWNKNLDYILIKLYDEGKNKLIDEHFDYISKNSLIDDMGAFYKALMKTGKLDIENEVTLEDMSSK